MPELPPNSPLGAVPEPREYTVKAGDTLASIALMMYGDRRRWPEIARRNELANPNIIQVGQRLLIP
jgi:nucleoid-associated protein YgaU